MSSFSSLLSGTKILEERKSEYNGDIKVIRSLGLGIYIQVEGLTQSGGIVTDVWRTTLKKLKAEKINNCLILGLGGGTVAKLIQKYWPKAIITGVEIDKTMIELGKKYLGLVNVEIVIGDAYEFVKKDKQKYDLVIVDLYLGDKYPQKFEKEEFFKKLTKNKIVVINRLYYGEKRKEAINFGSKLEKIFKNVEWFYPPANLMFICQKKGLPVDGYFNACFKKVTM